MVRNQLSLIVSFVLLEVCPLFSQDITVTYKESSTYTVPDVVMNWHDVGGAVSGGQPWDWLQTCFT